MRFRQAGAAAAVLAAAVVLAACTGTAHSGTAAPSAGTAGTGRATPAGNGIASASPSQILARSLAAARAAGSVHVSLVATAGSLTASISTDATLNDGREVITSIAGAEGTVLVVDGTGYVNANAAAWKYYFQQTSGISRLAGRWVEFTPGTADYSTITADVTLDSAISTYTLAGPLTSTGPTKEDGQAVVGVSGTLPASAGTLAGTSAVLYVAATGQPLPVGYQVSAGNSQVLGIFSKWGRPVSVTAPAGAISF